MELTQSVALEVEEFRGLKRHETPQKPTWENNKRILVKMNKSLKHNRQIHGGINTHAK